CEAPPPWRLSVDCVTPRRCPQLCSGKPRWPGRSNGFHTRGEGGASPGKRRSRCEETIGAGPDLFQGPDQDRAEFGIVDREQLVAQAIGREPFCLGRGADSDG